MAHLQGYIRQNCLPVLPNRRRYADVPKILQKSKKLWSGLASLRTDNPTTSYQQHKNRAPTYHSTAEQKGRATLKQRPSQPARQPDSQPRLPNPLYDCERTLFTAMTSYGEARLTGPPRANLVDDLNSTSGLVLTFGLVAFVLGTLNLLGAIRDDGVDWDGSDGVFPPILGLLGNLTLTLFGMTSVFVGFQYLTSRWGSKSASLFGLVITLAAWFPFLVTIAQIAFQAHHENIGGGPPLNIPFPASSGEVSLHCCTVFYGSYTDMQSSPCFCDFFFSLSSVFL